jgi:hypothetical protein
MFVWYVVKDGELMGVITRDEPDTYGCRWEAKNYPDCRVWSEITLGWCYMNTNSIMTAIWKPATPPDVVIMANMLRS